MKVCRWAIAISLILILVGGTGEVAAQNLLGKPTRGMFGLKAGIISRMEMSGGRDLHSEVGSTGQVFGDFPKGRGFSLTVAFDFYYMEINRSNQIMIEPNVGVKKEFRMGARRRVSLRPGLALGLTYLAEMGDLAASQYLSYKLFCETLIVIDVKKSWLVEVGVYNGPTGSAGDLDLEFGPGVFMRAGVAFR